MCSLDTNIFSLLVHFLMTILTWVIFLIARLLHYIVHVTVAIESFFLHMSPDNENWHYFYLNRNNTWWGYGVQILQVLVFVAVVSYLVVDYSLRLNARDKQMRRIAKKCEEGKAGKTDKESKQVAATVPVMEEVHFYWSTLGWWCLDAWLITIFVS